MKKITITGKKVLMEDEIEEVSEGIVKRIGNGAMILSSKKYIGKKVYVLTHFPQVNFENKSFF
jgi:putative transposon-encoded protein